MPLLRSTFLALCLTAPLVFAQTPAPTAPAPQGPQTPKIAWHKGPYLAQIGTVARLQIPAGYEFADGAGARTYLDLTHNIPEGSEVGILTPVGEAKEDNWVVLFDFDATGYVKDDEKSSIDAPRLLDSMQKGTERENEERRRKGWTPFHLVGWQTQPFYDSATHNLTWGTLGNSDDPREGQTVNYATRILGRRGVLRTDLVIDPTQVSAAVPKFKEIMGGFAFTSGSRYADFVKGDKVAEYGLTALIAGGATAIALKTGLFAKLLALLAGLWKLIVIGLAALGTRIKQIFAKIKNMFSSEEKGPRIEDQ